MACSYNGSIPPRPSPLGSNCGSLTNSSVDSGRDRQPRTGKVINIEGDYYNFKGSRSAPTIHHHYYKGQVPQQNYNSQPQVPPTNDGQNNGHYNVNQSTERQADLFPMQSEPAKRSQDLLCMNSLGFSSSILTSWDSTYNNTSDVSTIRPQLRYPPESIQNACGEEDADSDLDYYSAIPK